MTHTDEKVKWITRTALCTALVLLAQIVGRMLPAGAVIAGPFSINQLVTGSLVNLVLILAAASVGLWSGVACGVVSSVLAALLGMTPVPFIVPAIALGNAVIAAAAWFFLGKSHGTGRRAAGVLVGAGAKCAALWLTVPACFFDCLTGPIRVTVRASGKRDEGVMLTRAFLASFHQRQRDLVTRFDKLHVQKLGCLRLVLAGQRLENVDVLLGDVEKVVAGGPDDGILTDVPESGQQLLEKQVSRAGEEGAVEIPVEAFKRLAGLGAFEHRVGMVAQLQKVVRPQVLHGDGERRELQTFPDLEKVEQQRRPALDERGPDVFDLDAQIRKLRIAAAALLRNDDAVDGIGVQNFAQSKPVDLETLHQLLFRGELLVLVDALHNQFRDLIVYEIVRSRCVWHGVIDVPLNKNLDGSE